MDRTFEDEQQQKELDALRAENASKVELLKRYAERVTELGAENARLREALQVSETAMRNVTLGANALVLKRAGDQARAALAAKGAE